MSISNSNVERKDGTWSKYINYLKRQIYLRLQQRFTETLPHIITDVGYAAKNGRFVFLHVLHVNIMYYSVI